MTLLLALQAQVKLRRYATKLFNMSKDIVAITRRYRTPEGLPVTKNGGLENSRNENVFLGLALSSDDHSFSLTDQLIDAAAACEDLVTDLSKIRIEEHETELLPNSWTGFRVI